MNYLEMLFDITIIILQKFSAAFQDGQTTHVQMDSTIWKYHCEDAKVEAIWTF